MGKSTPKPPPAPDPARTAAAQGEANIESAIASTLLNNMTDIGPGGTVSVLPTGGFNVGGNFVPTFTRTTQLTPEGQQQFKQEQRLGGELTGLALDQTGRISGALGEGINLGALPALRGGVDTSGLQGFTDFQAEGDRLADATFQRGLGMLNPEFDRQFDAFNRIATERGLPFGSEASNNLLNPFLENRSNTLENLALSSIGAGRDEAARQFGLSSAQRGQEFNELAALNAMANAARGQGFQEQAFTRSIPINDIAALLGTSPGVAMPNFSPAPAFGVQAPDVIGATLGSANIAANNFAAEQQAKGGLLGGLFDLGGSLGSAKIISSDRRLKSLIKPYGKTAKGFNLYSYIINGVKEIGVIAQEVMEIMPEAIHERDGYLAVDYSMVN